MRPYAGIWRSATKIATRQVAGDSRWRCAQNDEQIAAAHRAQADALEIEARAKRRLADEYDAAQERREVATGREGSSGRLTGKRPANVADLGVTRLQVHEARRLRDAEATAPGIVRRTLDTCLSQGQEPTKAIVNKVVSNVIQLGDSLAFDLLPESATGVAD